MYIVRDERCGSLSGFHTQLNGTTKSYLLNCQKTICVIHGTIQTESKHYLSLSALTTAHIFSKIKSHGGCRKARPSILSLRKIQNSETAGDIFLVINFSSSEYKSIISLPDPE